MLFRSRHPATAIMMYSNVQTGAKILLGGVNVGLARLAYHSSGLVKNPISRPPAIVRMRKSNRDMFERDAASLSDTLVGRKR